MKKVFIILCVAALSVTAAAKEPDSAYRFKHYMHEIFKNYRNTNISIDMHDYGLAEVHTRHFLENLAKIPEFTADLRADGIQLDDAFLQATLDRLRTDVTALRKAIKARNVKGVETLRPELLQSCIGCHTEAHLKWLFRLPMSKNLFADYMHEIADNVTQAGELAASNELLKAEDSIKIANQYLSLLKVVTPYEGPSGVLLDRQRFLNDLRAADGFMLLVLEDFKENKPVDLGELKKPLNNVCVACHEATVIK